MHKLIIKIVLLNAVAALASPTIAGFPLLNRQAPPPEGCRNQSCQVATIAGSTGATVYDYPSYPVGDTQGGDCCIIRHFPAAKNAIYAARPGLQAYCALTGGDSPVDQNPPGVDSITVTTGSAAGAKRELSDVEKRDTTATLPCRPNILIFAKGTFEPGDVGISIGNTIQQSLDSTKWQVVGVPYDASLDGDFCLGLPGGVVARGIINQVFSTCPSSQIVLGGYSQGAMVVRNAIARIDGSLAAKVASVVTFGDPFCGAKIGQYSGPINVYCNQGDGVCDGQLNIGLAHLSYPIATTAAINYLKSIQK